MNRRNFLDKILVAGAGFSILPAALTYKRTWVDHTHGLIIPQNMTAFRTLTFRDCWGVEKMDICLNTILPWNDWNLIPEEKRILVVG